MSATPLPPPDDLALQVVDCVKHYQRGAPAYGSLRDTLSRLFRRERVASERVPALDGVTLGVRRGETLGVVGDNGAGKSTLLKVVARITPPDAGRIEVRGRLSSLIELGAGFHPELTGSENVLLHGSILGMQRRSLRRDLAAIAAFAGLDGAMDTPVKFFSTGMYARLGFAVAVHAAPRVLLIDEVLSVGDHEFRQRCYTRIADIQAAGTAILFVSHDLPVVQRLCDRVVHLEKGRIAREGDPETVVAAYRDGTAPAGR